MEENEDELTNEGFATPEEDEVQKNQESTEGYSTPIEGEVIEGQKDRAAKKTGKLKNGNNTKNDDEDCCTKKKKMKANKELKWRTINIFEKECIPPKSNPVPRHCITKKEHLTILSTPKQKCPPPCLQKAVVRKLAPVSPRIIELAKPTKHRILRTIQERSDCLPPELLDNLIKMLEVESSLSPEQATKLLRDRKCRTKKKRRKKRRQTKCKEKAREKRKANNMDQPRFDPEAVCCHYQMAEKFVKSILNWKCSKAKADFQDITEIILRRLSQVLEYTPTDGNGDRRSQQMRFLADVISCWISGVMTEVEEAHRESEEDRARRQREEEEEETDDEEDGLYGGSEDDGEDDDDDDDEDDDKDDRGKKDTAKKDKGEEDKTKEDDSPGDKDDQTKSESEVWEDAQMELEDKAVQEEPEVQEAEAQVQPEVAEKETEVDAQEEDVDPEAETDEEIEEPTAEDIEEIDDDDDKTMKEGEDEEKGEDKPTDEGEEAKIENAEDKEDEKAIEEPAEETEKEEADKETDKKADSLKLFQTDLPFINFMQIFSTIYKTMDAEEENLGQDPMVNRVHRAVFEKCYNAVMLEDPDLLTDNAKDLIDVMTGKIAVWLSKVLTESQILLFNKYPPQVESFEVRDWTKWLNDTTKTAKNWSEWLQSLIKEIKNMQDGKVSRGQWSDWTKQVDTDAALWRRFYLDAVHQAHHNVMMIRDREIVKTGEKNFPELEKEIRAVDL